MLLLVHAHGLLHLCRAQHIKINRFDSKLYHSISTFSLKLRDIWEQGWLSGRVTDLRSEGLGFKSRQRQQENCLLQGQLSVPAHMSVFIPPPCYCSGT